MRIFDKVSARLSFSPKYCRAVAETAIKPSVFMYHEAMSIFLGSKNVLNLVYSWVFQKYPVSGPPSHINRSPPPPGTIECILLFSEMKKHDDRNLESYI